MFCTECAKATAGKCVEHSQQRLDFYGQLFTISRLNSTYYPLPVCIACGKPSDFTTILPYGSQYEDDYLCGDCIRAFVDPIIKWKRNNAKID